MQTDKEKAAEILKKRRLAAKGIAERGDGKAIDPMEDVGSFAIDNDPDHVDTPEEKQDEVAGRALAVGLAVKP